MIKVENSMLILDNTFTKEDATAINEFVDINLKQERERIIKLINDGPYAISIPKGLSELATWEFILTEMKHQVIALIKGENK